MYRLISILATVGWLLAPPIAHAQNPIVPIAPCGTSTNQAASTAFVATCGGNTVPTEAALVLAPTASFPSGVTRLDYAIGNGAPPLFYRPETGTCAANSQATDTGSCTDTTIGDGNSWVAAVGPQGLDFREFGAVAGSDVSVIAQKAFNWSCTAFRRLVIQPPAVAYTFASQLTIGNGTSSVQSTQGGCDIEGVPYTGIAEDEGRAANQPMTFKWVGASGIIPILEQGPIFNLTFSGISLDCNSICNVYGMELLHVMHGHHDNLLIRNMNGGAGIFLTSYPTYGPSISLGALYDTFINDNVIDPVLGSGAGGIVIGVSDATGALYDPTFDEFINDNFSYDGNTTSSCGITLQFTDVEQFVGGVTVPVFTGGSPEGNALCVKSPTDAHEFPENIAFYDIELDGTISYDMAWTAGKSISFWPFLVGDYSLTIPVGPDFTAFGGVASTGQMFGVEQGSLLPFSGGSDALTTASTTNYISAGCSSTISGYACTVPIPASGQVRGISGALGTAPGAGQSVTFELVQNNSAVSAMACTATGASATNCNNLSATPQTVAAGDFVAISVTGTSGSATAIANASLLYDHN